MWRTRNFTIDVLRLLSAAKLNGLIFQQSSISLLHAIDPQNALNIRKNLYSYLIRAIKCSACLPLAGRS
jgi:hypothetical protein